MQSERSSLSSSSLSLATMSGAFGAQRSSSSSLAVLSAGDSALGGAAALLASGEHLSLSLREVLQAAGGSGVGVGGYARLVRELVALEKKYVERLQLLCKVFREPLARLAPKVRLLLATASSSFTFTFTSPAACAPRALVARSIVQSVRSHAYFSLSLYSLRNSLAYYSLRSFLRVHFTRTFPHAIGSDEAPFRLLTLYMLISTL